VTGLPTVGLRSGEYGRDPAPEMLSRTPYCPFRADIWQLGNMFMSSFSVHSRLMLNLVKLTLKISQHLFCISPDLVNLFSDMVSEDPASRPSALQALERVREIELNLSTVARQSRVPAIPDAEYSRRDSQARALDAVYIKPSLP
jgi:serine/threonine protein kinase